MSKVSRGILRTYLCANEGTLSGHFLETLGLENGTYSLSLALSPSVFYPEYPEKPKTFGEVIRKARDRQLT
jgi:hypothetical protein